MANPLIRRNLLLFFRDRSALFFAMLGVFVVLLLYVIFLRETMRVNWATVPAAGELLDCWILAGMLAITGVSTTLSAYEQMINDRATGIIKDFSVSPLKQRWVLLSYISTAVVIGFLCTVFVLVLGLAYLSFVNGFSITMLLVMQLLGLSLLSVLSGASLNLVIVNSVRSYNVFNSIATMVGTLSGFIAGVYVPLGSLPTVAQTVIKCFPTSYVAALYRRVLMTDEVNNSFINETVAQRNDFEIQMGIGYELGRFPTTTWLELSVVVGAIVVCFGVALMKQQAEKR
ncbi:ABC transporter permease [Brochothrix campestris]|uniref:ABC-type multidrug transport system, permease component n=2 Tax=Brochothrix campestris TaxID=2757 RepID=W7CMX4_9LIST|nr:ABC-type multidrug transport system, permease component [Brochothrix campestris FSL F6-1037]